MATDLRVVCRNRLDAEALIRTADLAGAQTVHRHCELGDLPAPRDGELVIVLRVHGSPWSAAECIRARERGHRLVVFGRLDDQEINALLGADVGCVVRNQVAELHALVRGAQLATIEPTQRAAGRLTPRERELAAVLAESPGMTRLEIAAALAVTDATAKVHLANLRRKLGATGKSQAALAQRIRTLGLHLQ